MVPDNLILGLSMGVAASLLAGLLQPTVRTALHSVLLQIRQALSSKETLLTGHWRATFSEREPDGTSITTTEEINITQQVDRIYGNSNIGAPHPRKFTYQAYLYHDLVCGFYCHTHQEPGATSGHGVFVLQLDAERRKMDGVCAWFDKDHKEIDTSQYKWEKSV